MKKNGEKIELLWSEAFRALVCMIPMLAAMWMGKTSALVALGQGGFFFSSLFLPEKIRGRLLMGSVLIALGLGFYLIGGTVAPTPWIAVIFTFFIAINLSFLSNWKVGGPLALTFIMIYTAGLNGGSPEAASANFMMFAFVLAWSTLVSMLPIWKPVPAPPVNEDQKVTELAEQGFRMGIGTSIALAVSYMFGFSKLGWAPSAVGNVVRYDQDISKKRALARFLGTLGGGILAVIVLGLVGSVQIALIAGAIFATLNGLFKKTKLGMMPFFYTATILILYSANDLASGKEIAWDRLVYNNVGIIIGLAVVYFSFPIITKLRDKAVAKDSAA
jgi:hypothetical protein